jgi:deoxycytidylate deaminase
MAADPATQIIPSSHLASGKAADESGRKRSQALLEEAASNELVFAVVGHIGSGASTVAEQLQTVLETELTGATPRPKYQVRVLKAREAILEWAKRHSEPEPSAERNTVTYVNFLQDVGDKMRAQGDEAAVGVALIKMLRAQRAEWLGVQVEPGKPVSPDGKRRAYIMDSIRHPAEVELLRQVYGTAFTLIGVVCEEDERLRRISAKLDDAGDAYARSLMKRDAKAPQQHGQRVSDAFHLSDIFLDNTPTRADKSGRPNPAWTVPDQLSRLVKIITKSEIVRPTSHETAMQAAHGAKARSACLSRQVGATLVDRSGNIIATGTNEVPKAGGGLYGASVDELDPEHDHRCAFTSLMPTKQCSNNLEQKEMCEELFGDLVKVAPELAGKAKEIVAALRSSRIGGLLEFSRAVHAEMDALLSAGRMGATTVGSRLYVTTFPCHYCARHVVSAGVDEVQYIEPYPKSKALKLHSDSITISSDDWTAPSTSISRQTGGEPLAPLRVLFRPFTGIAPRLYERAFLKTTDLKDNNGTMMAGHSPWGNPWLVRRVSYTQLEAELSKEHVEEAAAK